MFYVIQKIVKNILNYDYNFINTKLRSSSNLIKLYEIKTSLLNSKTQTLKLFLIAVQMQKKTFKRF